MCIHVLLGRYEQVAVAERNVNTMLTIGNDTDAELRNLGKHVCITVVSDEKCHTAFGVEGKDAFP